MMMKSGLLVLVCLLAIAGCGGAESGADGVPADSLTQRQRDSVVGESGLPGAGGVRGAIEASDAAADRNRAHDSLTNDG